MQSEFYPVQMAVANGHRLPSLFSTTSESFHAQLRRCVNSAFSMSNMIQYEPFVDSTTELFVSQTDKLYASTGDACNFSRWLQFYAFDVIGDMTYSKRHGFLEENKDIDGIIDYIGNLFNYVAPVNKPTHLIETVNFSLTQSTDWTNPHPRPLFPQKPPIPPRRQIRPRRCHLPRRTFCPRTSGRTLPSWVLHLLRKRAHPPFHRAQSRLTTRPSLQIHASQSRPARILQRPARHDDGCVHGFRRQRDYGD